MIEILVSISIIGLMLGMLLPAVQQARESARRLHCSNQLKNQTLAVLSFESTHRKLPPGRDRRHAGEFAWSFAILPWLEQENLHQRFDLKRPWNQGINSQLMLTPLPVFRCPSASREFAGDMDYAGVNGSVMGGEEDDAGSVFDRGVMLLITEQTPLISLASVTDGLSNTICITENHDRDFPDGTWVHGLNCISHDMGPVNSTVDGIRSAHPGGAYASKLDGSVLFLNNSIAPEIIAALATRNGGETLPTEF